MKQFNRAFFRDLWRLSKPYFSHSEERWSARGLFALVIVLNLVMVYMNYRITNWYNAFYDDMQNYKSAAVWHDIGVFLILAAIYIIAAVYQTYLGQALQIRWRRWMTSHYLQSWLGKSTYYQMQILGDGTDNPDQRIAEDLDSFTSQTLAYIVGIIGSITTLIAFVALLWGLSAQAAIPWHGGKIAIPGYLVWVALIYSVVGTYIVAVVGRPLIRLNFNQQRFQADFRFSLVRLRENSESIALYRGEEQENRLFHERFASLFSNFWQIMKRTRRLNWWQSGYGQIAIIFPFLVGLPAYLAKAFQIGTLIQISSAFGQVQGAFSFFANSYAGLAGWHAVVDRLRYFEQSMDEVREAQKRNQKIVRKDGPELEMRNLDIRLPDNRALLNNLNLRVPRGERLLIVGRSGSGKSTLIRVLSGIWPFGEGEVSLPERDVVFFLPQKPYLPLGPLRDVLLYPYGSSRNSTSELTAILEKAGLPGLAGQLDESRMWSQLLSPGEQQRIAFARIFIQRPSWIFMDEATSALDEPAEGQLYETLVRDLADATVVSVGHRSSLAAFHHSRLILAGDGTWRAEGLDGSRGAGQ